MREIINLCNGDANIGSDTPRIRPVPPPPSPNSMMGMMAPNDDNAHQRELPRINPPRPVTPPNK